MLNEAFNRLLLPPSIVDRVKLEESWRQRTEEAHKRYLVATERYNGLLKESHGVAPTAGSPLVEARDAQSAALEEYKEVLRIFTEFTVNGQIPKQESIKNGVQP